MTDVRVRDIFTRGLFEGEVRFSEPMSRHTSLRIGGPADVFAVPENVRSLAYLSNALREESVQFFALGSGTNVLVRDGGIDGAVVCMSAFRHIERRAEDSDAVTLSVGTGTLLQRLVLFSRDNGYAGIEGLAGIPGTVGGAICGNAGSFGYEMKDVLVSVDVMRPGGEIERVPAERLSFGYRTSSLARNDLVVSAEVRLLKGRPEDVAGRIEQFLGEKRSRQPIWEASAGCVFRNPAGRSAGRLIEEAGCKGLRIGDVVVSTLHANFFINVGGATAADFIALMREVAARVKETHGVLLEPEIRIVGRDDGDE